MAGWPRAKLLLSVSLILNLFFFSRFVFFWGSPELGWSRKAAFEAEAVAALSCSGHGRAYLDGVIVDGAPSCECNTCYAGPDCSHLMPACPADADSGDPMFLEPYWQQHASGSAVVVAGWHRMSYRINGDNFISAELERHIRRLHKAVNNAVTEGRFIVFGAGSTQLINAVIHALSSLNNFTNSPASVVATAPFYPMYKGQTDFFDSREYEWKGFTSDWANASLSATSNFIEFVTSPNNPDGLLKQPVLRGSAAIYDHAYYWPHYSAIPSPADEDVMLFTISKVSGHASSRFGWAVIKDERVYRVMLNYMLLNTFGVSRDTQLRILKIIKEILAEIGGEGDIFEFGYKLQKERWHKLNAAISSSNLYSLQQLSPQYCTYFKKIRDPSPAYAWLKCEMGEGRDCYNVLSDGGIISRGDLPEPSNLHKPSRHQAQDIILPTLPTGKPTMTGLRFISKLGELITLVANTTTNKVRDTGDLAKNQHDQLLRKKMETKKKLNQEIRKMQEEHDKALEDLRIANEKNAKQGADFDAHKEKSFNDLEGALEDYRVLLDDLKAFKAARTEVLMDLPPL